MSKDLETKIAAKIVDSALALGYAVSVNDGEETTVIASTDRAAILEAMQSTDMDRLYFDPINSGRQVGKSGWVLLVWGNEYDLISDWTVNADGAVDAILAPVIAWCNAEQALDNFNYVGSRHHY